MVVGSEGPTTYSGGQSLFVGRQSELEHLEAALSGARDGEPRLALIEGPAGIGKTALVERFLAGARSACTLRASGEQVEESFTFGVLDQLVIAGHRRLGIAPPDDEDRPMEPLLAGARLLDLVGELQRFGVTIVVVDDAQWADRPSLAALTFALRRLSADHVLVIVVARDVVEARLPDGLVRVLLADATVQLTLGGLSPEELVALSAQIADRPLSAGGAVRLHAHTGGNPLHARALIRQLPVSAFDGGRTSLPAPRAFALLVFGQMAAFSQSARELVAAASVLGRRCPVHLACEVAGLTDGLAALDEATASGLLREVPTTREIEFTHPLVQAAVYGELGAASRCALHRLAGDIVKDEHSRLRHRRAAATAPDAALARELADCGRRRMMIGDWGTAREHLQAASDLVPERAEREQLATEAIECQLMAGDGSDLAAVAGSLLAFEDTAWRSYMLARVALASGNLDEAEPHLVSAWRRTSGAGDTSLAARVAGQLTWLSVARDRGQDAVVWSERAATLAGAHSPTDISQLIRLVAFGLTGRAKEGLASLSELPDPATASAPQLDELLGRARLRSWTDDLLGARSDLCGVLGAAQGRSVTFRVIASAMLAEVEYLLGRWDDAHLHSTLAVSLAQDAEQAWLVSICDAVAALVPAARGMWPVASQHVDAASAHIVNPGHVVARSYTASARAHLAAARDDHREVINSLLPLQDLDRSSSVHEPGVLMTWQDLLAEALILQGRLGDALAVLEPFEERAAERARASAMAAAARTRGVWFSARRQHEDAVAVLQVGLEQIHDVPMPFERARLELALGASLRRSGKRKAAATALESARSTFVSLGAAPHLARCDRELAACGARTTAAMVKGGTALTSQEFAVSHLAAGGLTNREIARELVVSVKTVEYHLGHVYAKLHVTSRAQLARRFGDFGEGHPGRSPATPVQG